MKYLTVTITDDLRWGLYISNITSKANRTLGFIRRNIKSGNKKIKGTASKALVRPVLEYMQALSGTLTLQTTPTHWKKYNGMQLYGCYMDIAKPPELTRC